MKHAETKTNINMIIEEYDPDGLKIEEMKQANLKKK